MVRRNSHTQSKLRQHVKRTGGNCALCGEPIDYNLPYYLPGTRTPHPNAYVADHTTPLAKGGTHTPDNTQPAHYHCNSKKRARLTPPMIRRSGTLK